MNGIVFCDTNQTRYEFMANQLFGNSSAVDIKQFTYEFNFSKTGLYSLSLIIEHSFLKISIIYKLIENKILETYP